MDLPSISENQVNNSAKNAKEESEKQANIAAQKLKNSLNQPVLIEVIVPTIVTIVVFFLVAYLWYTNIVIFKPDKKEKIHRALLITLYILYILFNIYYVNSLSYKVCPTGQIMKSVSIVLTNFVLFILLTMFVLHVLPGFLEPFANVIGNMIISMKGVKLDEKLSFILLDPSKGSELSQKIAEEPSILLNSLSSLTLEEDIEHIQKFRDKTPIVKNEEDWSKEAKEIKDPSENALFIKNSTNAIKNLKKVLALRDAAAYFSWMVLAGFMFLSTNASQMLNVIDCDESSGGEIQSLIDSTYDMSTVVKNRATETISNNM